MLISTHINNVAAVAATTEVVEAAAVQQSLPRQHRVHAITCDNQHHTSCAYCQQRIAHSKLKEGQDAYRSQMRTALLDFDPVLKRGQAAVRPACSTILHRKKRINRAGAMQAVAMSPSATCGQYDGQPSMSNSTTICRLT